MKIAFQNIGSDVKFSSEIPGIIVCESPTLFSRLCESLYVNFASSSPEPASLTDDSGKIINVKTNCIKIFDPITLDLNSSTILTALYKKSLALEKEDEEIRDSLENTNSKIKDLVLDLLVQLNISTVYSNELDLAKYCKLLGLSIDTTNIHSLFDKLVKYIEVEAELFSEKIHIFVGLASFLNRKDYQSLIESISYQRLPVLLIENKNQHPIKNANILVIDFDYLENLQSEY